MKFNSILLIVFFLLQALNSSTVWLNEQSLKDAAAKTLKYTRAYHQETIKFENKENLYDLKLNYYPLILDNILFRFDEYGLLHIKFVNLKATVTGKHRFILGLFIHGVNEFIAQLNNFSWEQVFVVAKKDLGNGKLDIKFKPTEESAINFNIFFKNLQIKHAQFGFKQIIEKGIKTLDYNALKVQLKKVAQLILETLQSDLK